MTFHKTSSQNIELLAFGSDEVGRASGVVKRVFVYA